MTRVAASPWSSFPTRWLPAIAIVIASVAAYSNSFSGVFVFDDIPAILGPGGSVPAGDDPGATTAGRPLLRLTLAFNAWISGTDPWSYHLLNLLLHGTSALILLGVLRRVLAEPAIPERFSRNSDVLAAITALLWAVHPLQTAAVTYIVQRAEVLAALGVLLTLYAALRARAPGPSRRPWQAAALFACAAGMTAKETAVVAPLLVLLMNVAVPAPGTEDRLLRRLAFPATLALTWAILIPLVLGNAGRGGTAGFDAGITPWAYLLTQSEAILGYLTRVLWPHPLIFDYGTSTTVDIAAVALPLTLVSGAAAGSLVIFALGRRQLGSLGLGFFLILAPTSSFVPIASQTIAEHRMYLALAFPLLGLVLGLQRLIGTRAVAVVAAVGACALALATLQRNRDYHSPLALWQDTLEKRPENARAWVNHGLALLDAGEPAAALRQLDTAIMKDPRLADAHFNRGLVLARLGRRTEAADAYSEAIRLRPHHPEARNNLGSLALAAGRPAEAEAQFRSALAHAPAYDAARLNLGLALLDLDRPAEAAAEAEHLLRAGSTAPAHALLGNARLAQGRPAEARDAFTRAVAADPLHAGAHNNLGNLLVEEGRFEEAVSHYTRALAANPSLVPARRNLARLLIHLGRPAEARPHYEELLRLRPADAALREEYRRLMRP